MTPSKPRPWWALLALGLAACAHRREVGVEDLEGALAFIEAVHPSPALVDLAAAHAAVEAEAARRDPRSPPTFEARLRGAALAVGALGDAHVVVGTPPREVDGIVPVLPILLDGRVIVDAFVRDLPAGTVLRTIEGRPASEWLDELGKQASVDGGREEVRRAQAVRSFASLMYRYLGPRPEWTIETQTPDGTVATWTEAGVDMDGARALAAARVSAPRWGAAPAGPWPVWTRLDEPTAHLRLASFGTREVEEWTAQLDAGFAALREDQAVVVDLRGNAGGYRDLGVAVARHLLDQPFTQWASVSTRVRKVPRRYRDRVGFPVAPLQALATFPGARVAGGWRIDGDPLAASMLPVDQPHRGPVALFVDDGTSSAAVELAVALRAHRPGVTVVGTPTQGACDRHTGELPVTYDLGDGVVVMLSLFEVRLVPSPGCEAGSGLPLDVPVSPSLAEWAAGEDPWWRAYREHRSHLRSEDPPE